MIRGSSNIRVYSDSTCDSGVTLDHEFCSSCGSPLFTYNREKHPMGVIVSAGTMDDMAVGSGDERDTLVWKPSMELYCKSKPDWLDIEVMKKKEEKEGGLAKS